MNKPNWKDIAEALGVTAIVASLIFVGLQMKQAQDIAQNEISLGILEAGVEMNSQLNQYADIWVKGAQGDELSDTEALIFANLMNNLNDQAFWSVSMRTQLGAGGRPAAEIYNYARVLHENPGAREHWTEWQESFQPYRALRSTPLKSESFSGRVREALELMDEM
jgi:negative regulator of sigma E activity